MTDESYIFLAGASRGVGREIAKCLTEQGKKVKALLRSPLQAVSSGQSQDSRAELETMGVKVVMGDALDTTAVEPGFLTRLGKNGVKNCQNIDWISILAVQTHDPDINRLYPRTVPI